MKQVIRTAMIIVFLVCLALAGLAQAPNQSTENPVAALKQLTSEVQQLRWELAQQAIAFQRWKIQQLERELQPLQNERQRLAEQEQTIHRFVAELEQQARNAAASPEGTTGEVEAAKAAYTDKELKELATKQQSIAQRETELMEHLKQEQQYLEELLRKAKQLRS